MYFLLPDWHLQRIIILANRKRAIALAMARFLC